MVKVLRISQMASGITVIAMVFVVGCLYVGNYATDWNFEPFLVGIAFAGFAQHFISEALAGLMNTPLQEASWNDKVSIHMISSTLTILVMISSYLLVVEVLYPRFG